MDCYPDQTRKIRTSSSKMMRSDFLFAHNIVVFVEKWYIIYKFILFLRFRIMENHITTNKKFICEITKKALQSAIFDYTSLYDYYLQTSKTIIKEKKKFKDKYKYAMVIANALDSIFTMEEDARQEKINEIKSIIIANSTTIGDIFSNIELDENRSSIMLNYNFKELKSKSLDPAKAKREEIKINEYQNIFVRSILSNIITIFENYFSKIIKTLIILNPERYFENTTIKISNLIKEDSISILNRCVDEKVDKLIFDSLETLNTIEQKDKICIDRYTSIKKEFEEIYYRRNVYIHNSGYANKIYIKNIDKMYSDNVNIGDKLICDDIYLENALNCLAKIMCSIYYETIHLIDYNQHQFERCRYYAI